VESRGGATVYRFTPASVRRAFEAGWDAARVHDFLAALSRTPVPQPLRYLVDDTARSFGSIRIGPARAFVRAQDEAALAGLLHHRGAAELKLRAIAPTVLVSPAPVEVLLPALRALGVAAVSEAADGTVEVTGPTRRRAARPPSVARAAAQAREPARIAAVVKALRAGDASAGPRQAGRLAPGDTLARLREAAETATPVVIAYADGSGQVSEQTVRPVRVDGGVVVATARAGVRSFALHRVQDVRPAEPDKRSPSHDAAP
jgi:hypothetical protein